MSECPSALTDENFSAGSARQLMAKWKPTVIISAMRKETTDDTK